MEFVHISVLFDEAISALELNEQKIIADGTAGGGGHSREIAKTAKRLIAIDQDPDAISVLNERIGALPNVTIVHNNFSDIKNIVDNLGLDGIDGMLLDLGVSSFQLDNGDRGFSFHQDAPLDMRMSKNGLSAYDVVNSYDEQSLADVIWRYGEEKFRRSIAKNIVQSRADKPIETTFELVDIIISSMPQSEMKKGHPARKTFQAIRIEVNAELEHLNIALDKAFDALNSGGRLCIISFHSLEDRLVKQRFASFCKGCICPPDFPQCVCGKKPSGLFVNRLPIAVSLDELEVNNRSRSAKLRIIEKI